MNNSLKIYKVISSKNEKVYTASNCNEDALNLGNLYFKGLAIRAFRIRKPKSL